MLWSTSTVERRDAVEYWREVVCRRFVGVQVDPAREAGFGGTIKSSALEQLSVSRVRSTGQRVRRDIAGIAADNAGFVLLNVQISGHGMAEQRGRIGRLSPGSLVMLDSTAPYSMEFTGPFEQVVARIPQELLPNRSLRTGVAVELPGNGAARVVGDFFVGLSQLETVQAKELESAAFGLAATALAMAAGNQPDDPPHYVRERVHRFVEEHAFQVGLDVATVAAACGVSRRTLFRALEGGESLNQQIRRLRITRAQELLSSRPERGLPMIAASSGFSGVAQLHRTFKAETGRTPGEYRALLTGGTNRHTIGH